MAERFPYAKEKQRGSITVRAALQHLPFLDYGSSFAKKYCRYYVVRYRIAAIGFILALFIGLRSRKETGITR